MSEEQRKSAEDLDVEESEAASVAGGRALAGGGGDAVQSDIAGLQAKGYIEEACTTEGTLWVNPKTKHKVTVRGR